MSLSFNEEEATLCQQTSITNVLNDSQAELVARLHWQIIHLTLMHQSRLTRVQHDSEGTTKVNVIHDIIRQKLPVGLS